MNDMKFKLSMEDSSLNPEILMLQKENLSEN
jgi:hypothetical protein